VFLYNIPFFTNPIELATSLELLRSGAFAGIKDSGGKWDDFVTLQQTAAQRDLAVLIGNDAIWGWAAKAGAAGVVSGVASALPDLMAAVGRAARVGADTAALDAHVQEFIDRILQFPIPIGIREAAALRGISVGPHASPLGAEGETRLDEFSGLGSASGCRGSKQWPRMAANERECVCARRRVLFALIRVHLRLLKTFSGLRLLTRAVQ